MRRVAEPGQENYGAAGASPIKHFKLGVLVYGCELDAVWRRVMPGGRILRAKRRQDDQR
jgi:hypothetical protein